MHLFKSIFGQSKKASNEAPPPKKFNTAIIYSCIAFFVIAVIFVSFTYNGKWQAGLIAGIELVKNRETKEPYSGEEKVGMKICLEARKRGLITRPLDNVLVVMPPLCINVSQLNKIMDILYESLEVVTETG